MNPETYIYKDRKKLRCGYTTGSCAAAAAKAAAWMLLTGECLEQVTLPTPKGTVLTLSLEAVSVRKDRACAGVRKDGGDDADATDGMLILAEVRKERLPGVHITGGAGIGRVTRPGLDQPPGSYAINRVPREMIREQVETVTDAQGYAGGLTVTISAPEGEERAARTFNPALGITGGISILGTSGIVEPMSEKALVDTIALELRMQAAAGRTYCAMTPGNFGMRFAADVLGLASAGIVKCSNFIGDALDLAASFHIKGVLLVGHLGKLVKLGAGMMNTHSRYGDGRMEILCACALEAGAETALLRAVTECVTTDAAVSLLRDAGLSDAVMDVLLQRIGRHLDRRVFAGMEVGAVVFSDAYGLLGKTERADALIAALQAPENRAPAAERERL